MHRRAPAVTLPASPLEVAAAVLFASPSLVALAVVAVLALPIARLVLRRHGRTEIADDLWLLAWPVRALAAALVARSALGAEWVPDSDWVGWALPILTLLAVAAGAWVVTRGLAVVKQVLFRRLRIDVSNNQRARSRRTQLQLVERVVSVFVWATAALIGLLTFEPVRDLGPALVAYAGVIGVVLGLALRAPLESLMSGIIVATSEPIRMEDVVVVEGQYGNIEEIGLTHVVVRLWDQRRLVLPTSYFITEPFENWTRRGATVVGNVTFSADFAVPVDAVRAEFERLVRSNAKWDGDECTLQVVDMGEQSIQFRGLMSAPTAGDAWDLRCDVREGLLAFLAGGRSTLPRVRTQPASPDEDGDGGRRTGGPTGDDHDGAAVEVANA